MNPKPSPLVQDAGAPQAQRALLEAARRAPPVVYDVASGAARFHAALESLSAAPAYSPAPLPGSVAMTLAKLKLLGTLVSATLLALVGYGVFGQTRIPQEHTTASASKLARPIPLASPAASQDSAPLAASLASPERARPAPVAAWVGPALAGSRRTNATQPAALASRAANAGANRQRLVRADVAVSTEQVPHGKRSRIQRGAPNVQTTVQNVVAGARAPSQAALAAAPAAAATEAHAADAAARPAPVLTAEPFNELQAIAHARRLVMSSPRAALALLTQLRREHPRGYFGEEREALTVLALYAIEDSKEAERQAHIFLERHPQSPYVERIRNAATR